MQSSPLGGISQDVFYRTLIARYIPRVEFHGPVSLGTLRKVPLHECVKALTSPAVKKPNSSHVYLTTGTFCLNNYISMARLQEGIAYFFKIHSVYTMSKVGECVTER